MKIAVAGTGYVGLSLATLLSQQNEVVAVDILPEKVEKINNRISPIQDNEIEEFFKTKELNLKATLDPEEAYKGAEFVIIAAPIIPASFFNSANTILGIFSLLYNSFFSNNFLSNLFNRISL